MLLRTLALLLLALSSGMSATLRNYKSQEDLNEEAPVLGDVAAEAYRQQETVLDDVPVAEPFVADEPAAEVEVPAAAVPDAPPLPATEDIIVEEPALEPDTAADPAVEEPVAGEPGVETPVSQEAVPEEAVPEEAVPEEAVPEVPVGESAAVEEPVDASPVAEAPEANEPVPDMDAMADAAVLEDLAEKALGHETPAEEAPTEDAPAQDAPAEDAPAVDAPAEDALAEDEPAEDALTEDALTEDAPVEDAPAEDAPVEDAPAGDAPAEVEGNDIEALPEILRTLPKLEDSAWGLNSIRDSFQAVNGYFDSLVELVGGRNGVCQYRCKYDKAPVHRPGYQIPEPNGCSSSLLGFQYFDMGVPAMTKCCDQLDICYDTCGSNKYRCDSKFRWCVHGICADLKKSLGFVSKVEACEAVADTLYNTVWTLGCRPYLTSQRAACFCEGEEKDEL